MVGFIYIYILYEISVMWGSRVRPFNVHEMTFDSMCV